MISWGFIETGNYKEGRKISLITLFVFETELYFQTQKLRYEYLCIISFSRQNEHVPVNVAPLFNSDDGTFFRCVHASLYEGLSVRPSVVRWSRVFFESRNSSENAIEMIESLLQSNFKTKF